MKNIKGPIILGVVLLMMAFLLPAYAHLKATFWRRIETKIVFKRVALQELMEKNSQCN